MNDFNELFALLCDVDNKPTKKTKKAKEAKEAKHFKSLELISHNIYYGFTEIRRKADGDYNHYCLIGASHPLYGKSIGEIHEAAGKISGFVPSLSKIGFATKNSRGKDGTRITNSKEEPFFYMMWTCSTKEEYSNNCFLVELLKIHKNEET